VPILTRQKSVRSSVSIHPFQVVDVTTGVPVRVWTYVIENAATKNFKYDFGEEIIFFTQVRTELSRTP
jgi:hypothetical protein